jgi:ferredoxin
VSHVITEKCVGSTHEPACLTACPTDSIHPRKDEADFEGTKQLFIDPSTCIDCGVCIDECPEKAIFAEADVPAESQASIEANAAHFK